MALVNKSTSSTLRNTSWSGTPKYSSSNNTTFFDLCFLYKSIALFSVIVTIKALVWGLSGSIILSIISIG